MCNYIADVLTGSYYTKVLSDKDIEPILKKFKQIANNKNENYNNSISNIASTSLGDFYHLGLYTEKDLNTSQKYYGLAAHRNDFDAAISAGWVNFLNEDYDKSKYYNDLVIKNSNDPFVRAFAFNNNGVVDSEAHGAGTNYQLEQWKKSAELVLNYNYNNNHKSLPFILFTYSQYKKRKWKFAKL